MNYSKTIGELCYQLNLVSDRIASMSENIVHSIEEGYEDVAETYTDLRMDELEHAQVLILKLTELITKNSPDFSESHADEEEGSVFASGDLNCAKDKEEEK